MTEDQLVIPDPILLVADGPYWYFRVTVTEMSRAHVRGVVDETSAWDADTLKPCDFEQYLRFYLKWDGCCHVWFGDEDGYLHLCGAESWTHHAQLMAELFQWAMKTIPMSRALQSVAQA